MSSLEDLLNEAADALDTAAEAHASSSRTNCAKWVSARLRLPRSWRDTRSVSQLLSPTSCRSTSFASCSKRRLPGPKLRPRLAVASNSGSGLKMRAELRTGPSTGHARAAREAGLCLVTRPGPQGGSPGAVKRCRTETRGEWNRTSTNSWTSDRRPSDGMNQRTWR